MSVPHTSRSSISQRRCGLWFTALAIGVLVAATNRTVAGKELENGATDFKHAVAPILAERCANCHNARKREGGLDVTNRQSLLDGGDSGPAVAPSNPDESWLLEMISGDEPMMPKNSKRLTDDEVAAVRSWIEAGAEWPEHVTVSPELWSLQPLQRSKPPQVENSQWVTNPIDAFVLQKLEGADLQPAPAADRIALIRRATFDLHGLPPTPEEIDVFVADDSPDAFAKVIDRLLASPRYGERWGRHWLDLASYADSHGFELDYPRTHAWHYRDYVIKAFNDDVPYDQFLEEQIAGDVLEPKDPRAIIATGFLAAGPWDYSGFITAFQETAASRLTRSMDIDNMMTTVMTTTVALTVGCARCHDHKFDPIPQKDYYSLQAVFAGVRRGDRVTHGEATREQMLQMEQMRLDIHKKRISVAEIDTLTPEQRSDETPQNRAKLVNEIASLEAELAKLPRVELAYAAIPDEPPPMHLLNRGDTESPGERVAPTALSAVKSLPASLTDADASEGERRLALARWLTDPANPLTARVMVNRLWHFHFGRGIVGTPGDFGFNGERPSHPELLDWLASEFKQRNWSIKDMHRLIMLSSVYQQSSEYNAKAASLDADNRLLWRMNRRRLSAEEVHDAILAVSGQLNLTMAGPAYMPFHYQFRKSPLYDYHSPGDEPDQRRSIYRFIVRSTPDPFMDVLDFPVPAACTPARSATTTALQSLSLLNDPFVVNQAEHFADRLQHDHGENRRTVLEAAYRITLGREPSEKELLDSEQFVEKYDLFHFCRTMFNTNEFLYLD